MDHMKRLAKAKTSLVLEHPFIGTVALNMPYELTDQVPTAATDGKRIVFNPEFLDKLSDDEVKFLVAHECMHPMLEHNYRMKGRNARKWNKAADYVINKLLKDEGIGSMPEGGLISDDIYTAGNGTSDGIYNILPEDPDDGDSGGAGVDGYNGTALDECVEASGSPAEVEQQANDWKIKTAQAAQAAKMMGKLSAGMARLVEEVLSPRVDWRDVLSQFIERAVTDDRTWERPNRRLISQGLYLPSNTGEATGEIVVAIDCSGSIGQRELDEFAAEVRGIKEEADPSHIHVIYFDSEVCHYDVFERDDDVELNMHGGGGTAFSPVFAFIKKEDIDPVACVFLTDLYCNDFGEQPSYPVLWVTNGQTEAPFGDVVSI